MSDIQVLDKGTRVDVTELAEKAGVVLDKVLFECGWDVNDSGGADFDLDAMLAVLDDAGKVLGKEWFIHFQNKNSPNGAISHSGDNLTGQGDGPDETITTFLSKLPATAAKVQVGVFIFQAQSRNQKFGQVDNAFARFVADGIDPQQADLTENFSGDTGLVLVELYRHNGGWKIRGLMKGYKGGANEYATEIGADVRFAA